VLNRETRDALSVVEKSYLNESFQYTGGGLAITAIAARAMFKNGFAYRVMAANPCKLMVCVYASSMLTKDMKGLSLASA
jgi:hypothetical protein